MLFKIIYLFWVHKSDLFYLHVTKKYASRYVY